MNPLEENNEIVASSTHSPEKVDTKKTTKVAKTTKPNAPKNQRIPKVAKKMSNKENTKITSFYTIGKNRADAKVQTSAKKRSIPDIYLKILEDPVSVQQKSSGDDCSVVISEQSDRVCDEQEHLAEPLTIQNRSPENPDVDTAPMMGPNVSSMLEYIVKLESMVDDEKKAKEKILSDYRMLKKKYVSNLQALVNAQKMLINRTPQSLADQKVVAEAIEDSMLMNEDMNIDVNKYMNDENRKELDLIDENKRRDAEFIRKLISMMYQKENLISKTVSGRLSRKNQNNALTPEKLKFIHHIFAQRVDKCSSDVEEKVARTTEAHINKLVANAISNIKRSKSCN